MNMVSYVDCHAHLYSDEFKEDIDVVIEKAKATGVKAALVVAENKEDFAKILKLSDKFDGFCLPCFGIHPVQGDAVTGDSRSVNIQDLEAAIPLIEEHHDKLFAIGECGLDFTPHHCKHADDKDNQRQVLLQQIEISKKFELPINVHSRSAGRPTIALLKEAGVTKALLHAFDGKPSVAIEGVRQGFYFSIPPSIVRSEQKQKLVEKLPLENLLLETDSPALGPEKQVRNEPSNIRLSCEWIANIKKVDPETVARITTQNAIKLFPKLQKYFPK